MKNLAVVAILPVVIFCCVDSKIVTIIPGGINDRGYVAGDVNYTANIGDTLQIVVPVTGNTRCKFTIPHFGITDQLDPSNQSPHQGVGDTVDSDTGQEHSR